MRKGKLVIAYAYTLQTEWRVMKRMNMKYIDKNGKEVKPVVNGE